MSTANGAQMADAKELEPVVPQKQLSRDLNAAREAYKAGDVEAARAAHGHGHGHGGHSHGKAPEAHSNTPSEYIKSMVFGGLDGIITTFAVVAAVAGADMSGDLVRAPYRPPRRLCARICGRGCTRLCARAFCALCPARSAPTVGCARCKCLRLTRPAGPCPPRR